LLGAHFPLLKSEVLGTEVEGCIEEMTRPAKGEEDGWKVSVIEAFRSALIYLGETPNGSKSIKLIEFFNEFPRLRNKMDAHGAPTSNDKAEIAKLLSPAVTLLLEKLSILRIPLVRVDIQDNGRAPRIIDVIGESTQNDKNQIADDFFRSTGHSGIYIRSASGAREAVLIRSNPELSDFFYANGSFNESKENSEFLSYFSNKKIRSDCQRWVFIPKSLPQSTTSGADQFRLEGSTLTNYPGSAAHGYIARPQLESEIVESLVEPYRRIVTLRGMGGIGKTSLALEIAKQACANRWFDAIIWMSARDIDIHESRTQRVQPDVQTFDEVGQAGIQLFKSVGEPIEDSNPGLWLKTALSSDHYGSVLWVLDNFETIQNPSEVYKTIEKCLRPPNKVLITTRHRDFNGDWSIEVKGLEPSEFRAMVTDYSARIRVELPQSKIEQVFTESEGHPFLVKLMVAEFKANPRSRPRGVLAKEGLLDDLFERTYSRLDDDASHLFLLLCSWKEPVWELIIDLAVNEPDGFSIDTEKCVSDLVENSLLESSEIDKEYILQVPTAAREFGKRKLKTHDKRVEILAQSEVIQLFGPAVASQLEKVRHRDDSRAVKVADVLWRRIQPRLSNESLSERFLTLAKRAARSHPEIWLKLAEYYDGILSFEESRSAYKQYIEIGLGGKKEWRKLAQACKRLNLEREAIQAWISSALCVDATLSEISEAANRVNSWIGREVVQFSDAEKRVLIQPLVAVMEPRIADFGADDCSRLAYLYKKLGQYKDAERVAELGLTIDPENEHCKRIVWRN
jgi:tetratricopeptide (TPR) repeat protein